MNNNRRDFICRRMLAIGAGMVFAILSLQGEDSKAVSPGAPITTSPSQPKTTIEQFKGLKWDTRHAGREIDLSHYRKTFNDDFRKMDIVKDDSSPGPGAVWFSPGHGAFKANSPLRKDGPFALVEDGVRLRVEKVGNRYLGACMTSVNTRGEGFAQQYGYFEATIKYHYKSPGNGIWGAFWAKSQQDYFTSGTTTRTEIDFSEFYGDPGYHATVHLWGAAKPQPGETITVKNVNASGFKAKLAPGIFKPLMVDGVVQGFHHYGGEITPEWVIMYFDRKELGRFPMVEEWRTPLYLLLDSDPSHVAKNPENVTLPLDMIIRNVSAYTPVKPYQGQSQTRDASR